MNKGCLLVVTLLLLVLSVFTGAVVWLWLTGPDAPPAADPDARSAFAPEFINCTQAEETHLAAVHRAVLADADVLDEFQPEQGSLNSRREVRRKLGRLANLAITCENDVPAADCPLGGQGRGLVVMGEAQLSMCRYTDPSSDFCDSYAAMVYAHALTRGMWPRDAQRYHGEARALCRNRVQR